MENFPLLIPVAILTTFLSLSGGFLLLFNSKKVAKLLQKFGTLFSAIVLLAIVFLDIIPEIIEEESLSPQELLLLIFSGFVVCLLLSFFAGHFHKHGDKKTFQNKKQAVAMLIVDSLHTCVDGIVLGTSFVVSPETGFLTALATSVHEIPQEIGDFSIMIRAKIPKKKILKLQILSGLILIPSSMIAFFLGDKLVLSLPTLLALIAGFFLYIAFGEIWSIIKTITEKEVKNAKNH